MKNEEAIIKTIRTVYQTEEFIGFYNSLPAAVQKKYDYTLDIVQRIHAIPTKFFEEIRKGL